MLKEVAYEALKRYFDTLKKLGYVKRQYEYKLLVLIFIEELLDYDYFGEITLEDFKVLDGILDCLSGSCLIPDLQRKLLASPLGEYLGRTRISEDLDDRFSEDQVIRVVI